MNPNEHDTATPSPEFLNHLEWQVEREARRNTRFNTLGRLRVQPRVSTRSFMIIFLMMIAATSVGAVGAIAVSSQSHQEETELARLRAFTQLELAQLTVGHVEESIAQMEALVNAGAASEEELHDLRVEQSAALMEARLAESRVQEIDARRAPAEDHLGARRVKGMDYVTQRLHVRLEHAVAVAERARHRLAYIEELYNTGMVPDGEVKETQHYVRSVEHEILRLSRLVELRAAVVEDQMLPIVAELEAHKLELRLNLEGTIGELERVEAEFERARQLVERQLASPRELREFEIHAMRIRGELRLLEAELGIVERRLEERRPAPEPKKQ